MTTGQDIRQEFINYFSKNGHQIVKSSSLLPPDDTLLFTNAGMNQFKDVFTGSEKRDYTRAVTAQKCIRAGGKHNDLEEVGKTARHHTFFEMLGNFSFGDYFKEQAIVFAWELLLKEFNLPLNRLWFTVYEDDEEALELWKKVGAPADRILKFGKKDNFWQMGETGPCGPCSEIHFHLGSDLSDNKAEYVNGPGDQTVEIWNLVFMQFDRLADGTLLSLPKPSVDTGAGLERLASVLQGKTSNYETDLIRPIIDFISSITEEEYKFDDHESNVSMRVLADHARTTAFAIADGIYPSNTGRNYVLRKIMRRAIWHGRRLGISEVFLHKITGFVVSQMGTSYPELLSQTHVIEQITSTEEKLFLSTLSAGQKKLDEAFGRASNNIISGIDAFDLYQTYGLPIDMIEFIGEQRGMKVDIDGFEKSLEEERQRARESWKGGTGKQVNSIYLSILDKHGKTKFEGYSTTSLESAQIKAIISNNSIVKDISKGESGEIILDHTPFYAESGGQVGDTGFLNSNQATAKVVDTVSPTPGLIVHKILVEKGQFHIGDLVSANVDAQRRQNTVLNHTATHLLHAALKEILGPHVKQAGSEVAPDRLRFDFTHFAPLTIDEIHEVERLVNMEIRLNKTLGKNEMEFDTAIASGAVALFGEKYGSTVRVVEVPGFSKELCGGTHVHATGDIGIFKITSDSSIAAGTRRIIAITGEEALMRYQQNENLVGVLVENFKTAVAEIPTQVDKLQSALRSAEREIESLKLKLAHTNLADAIDSAYEINGIKILTYEAEHLTKSNVRNLVESLVQKLGSGVVIIGNKDNGRATLAVRVSTDLTNKLNAGKIVKELATIIDGSGGGKADFAEAGGKDPSKLQDALQAAYTTIEYICK